MEGKLFQDLDHSHNAWSKIRVLIVGWLVLGLRILLRRNRVISHEWYVHLEEIIPHVYLFYYPPDRNRFLVYNKATLKIAGVMRKAYRRAMVTFSLYKKRLVGAP